MSEGSSWKGALLHSHAPKAEQPAQAETEGDWRDGVEARNRAIRLRQEEAQSNPVYLAKGPIVIAIVFGNIITGAIGALIYFIMRS